LDGVSTNNRVYHVTYDI